MGCKVKRMAATVFLSSYPSITVRLLLFLCRSLEIFQFPYFKFYLADPVNLNVKYRLNECIEIKIIFIIKCFQPTILKRELWSPRTKEIVHLFMTFWCFSCWNVIQNLALWRFLKLILCIFSTRRFKESIQTQRCERPHESSYGCKKCDVILCKGNCFDEWHQKNTWIQSLQIKVVNSNIHSC